jgi:RNA polymerase sigma factor (sigma-70 family)
MENPSWPSFLDLLERDPNRAFKDFYRLAVSVLTITPPRTMRTLCKEDQEDIIQETIYHCVKDNFRVIKQYVNTGRPFTAWFHAVAHNIAVDYIRAKGREPEPTRIPEGSNPEELIDIIPNPDPGPDSLVYINELMAAIRRLLKGLGDYCRLLVDMAADGFTPKEIAMVLRASNKKVSDDLRYCRERLKKRLAKAGFDYFSE